MTLQQLAQKVGTTPQTIQRLETDNMTVSLDWLSRIADAFGMATAALIVTETTVSVPVIGEISENGVVEAIRNGAPKSLSLVISAPSPVGVRVADKFDAFCKGTVLIGDRMEFDRELLVDHRKCILGLHTGQAVVRDVEAGSGGPNILPRHREPNEQFSWENILWIAPILMAIQYF